jgi:hypothetical protein
MARDLFSRLPAAWEGILPASIREVNAIWSDVMIPPSSNATPSVDERQPQRPVAE